MNRAGSDLSPGFMEQVGLAYPTSPIWAISAFGPPGTGLTIAIIEARPDQSEAAAIHLIGNR